MIWERINNSEYLFIGKGYHFDFAIEKILSDETKTDYYNLLEVGDYSVELIKSFSSIRQLMSYAWFLDINYNREELIIHV